MMAASPATSRLCAECGVELFWDERTPCQLCRHYDLNRQDWMLWLGRIGGKVTVRMPDGTLARA